MQEATRVKIKMVLVSWLTSSPQKRTIGNWCWSVVSSRSVMLVSTVFLEGWL